MVTYLSFSTKHEEILPRQFQNDDNRFPLPFAKYFIDGFSKPFEKVLDPFAGFGTSLMAAEKLNRVGYGVELDINRYNYIKSRVSNKTTIIHGSSVNISEFKFPVIDFSITSPPYMSHLEGTIPTMKDSPDGTYEDYLSSLKFIYSNIKQILKKDAYIVIEVANLIDKGVVSTLAWDICKVISEVFTFRNEIVICWEGKDKGNGIYGYGYDHSYCLLFQNLKS